MTTVPSTLYLVPSEKKKTVSILGATGTIGQNTLKIVAAHPDRFQITALTGANNVALLAAQAKKYKPQRVVIANAAHYNDLKSALSGTDIQIAAGEEAVCEAAAMEVDTVVSAIVGAAGLKPTLAAIAQSNTVALANKESLVSAGALVTREARKHDAMLIPVDSEHNAIFQLLYPHPNPLPIREREAAHSAAGEGVFRYVENVTITASGGPFRNFTREQMKTVTPEQAVKHPNWNMGAKISVDSATLMNKGLELIEAFYLFPLKPEQLNVLIHPQSIVHALVQMVDGSVLAQMSHPDMCTPIACALAWPERIEAPVKKLDFAQIASLSFEAPDMERFPALKLAINALKAGGNAATVLNAANEIAVHRFLKKDIGFLDIAALVEKTLEAIPNSPLNSLEDVLACDQDARRFVEGLKL